MHINAAVATIAPTVDVNASAGTIPIWTPNRPITAMVTAFEVPATNESPTATVVRDRATCLKSDSFW